MLFPSTSTTIYHICIRWEHNECVKRVLVWRLKKFSDFSNSISAECFVTWTIPFSGITCISPWTPTLQRLQLTESCLAHCGCLIFKTTHKYKHTMTGQNNPNACIPITVEVIAYTGYGLILFFFTLLVSFALILSNVCDGWSTNIVPLEGSYVLSSV